MPLEAHPRRQRDADDGFTLIELLVVVIIIGILASMAVTVFLDQRKKAWDAAIKSDLRQATTTQEVYFIEEGEYTSNVGAGGLEDEGFNPSQNITVTVRHASTQRYCLEGVHTSNPSGLWHVDSAVGRISRGACPVIP